MINYFKKVLKSYIKQAPSPVTQTQLSEIKVVKPVSHSVSFHRHGKQIAVTVTGENLWFCNQMQVGPYKQSIVARDISQKCIQFYFDPEDKPHFSPNDDRVKVQLWSHFCNPVKNTLQVTHKVYQFTFRQEQLAKLTPSELIETAYLSALLEQHPVSNRRGLSQRFDTLQKILKEIVTVVPVESIIHTIFHYIKQTNIVIELVNLLMASHNQISKCSSSLLLKDLAVVYTYLVFHEAMTGEQFKIASKITPETMYSIQRSMGKRKLTTKASCRKAYSKQMSSRTNYKPATPTEMIADREYFYLQEAHADIADLNSEADFSLLELFLEKHPLKPQILFLIKWHLDVNEKSQTTQLDACSGISLQSIYPLTSQTGASKDLPIRPPLDILAEGRRKLSWLTKQTIQVSPTANPSQDEPKVKLSQLFNSRMLQTVNDIRSNELKVCTSLLGAFMEEQIKVPLMKTSFDTARALNIALSAAAVGVWAMFSLSLGDLQAVVSSIPSRSLLVEVTEYIRGVFKQETKTADKKYAGKLQFIVQGLDQTVSCNSHYVSYSLERQLIELCKKLDIDVSTPLEMLIKDWDKIFKNDVLSMVVPTHRSLIARWLKWALMIHHLREELARYTAVGVVGLVNSGKSLLVSTLFDIKVPVGTTAIKRTTVPFLYNLDGIIDGLDVIDFPGVDDRDETIPDLAELLLALAQVVVFVVDYRKAHTESAKKWLELLVEKSLPVLVCLTYADKLYAEHMGKDGSHPEPNHIKQEIVKETAMVVEQIGHVPSHEVKFFSFCQDRDSVLNTPDGRQKLREAGIGNPQEVGDWLAGVFESQLDQDELAGHLRGFIHRDE